MTEEQARRILGVTVDATMAEIKAAFYAKAKQYHPDVNPDSDAIAKFQRVEEAYRILIGCQSAYPAAVEWARGDGGTNGPPHNAAGWADDLDLIACVREVLATLGVTILFDGTIRVGSGHRAGYGPDEAAAWLARSPDLNFEELLDDVVIALRRAGRKLSVGEVKRALRKIVREDQRDRANFIMRPLLFGKLDPAELVRAQAEWSKLGCTVFEGDTALVIAVLQHFIWQVKRKQLDLPVDHHLMPIVVSGIQGTGKTTFVRRFIGVLQELASPPMLLSDLADRRSGDVFRFPVIFADDPDPLDPRAVSTLKAVLTATAISRRRLGTSMTDKRSQRTTAIGTANVSVVTLIPDPTGQRRFAELQFRNGNAVRGGDPVIWAVVESADYALLWRSVDGHAPSPILPHLAALAAFQDAASPPDQLRDWLYALDLDSDAVVGITARGLMAGADDLRLLFCAQTGEEISNNRFERRMAALVGDPQVPFRTKQRVSEGCFYPVQAAGARCFVRRFRRLLSGGGSFLGRLRYTIFDLVGIPERQPVRPVTERPVTNDLNFADKYRPQTFAQVFGQESAVGYLSGLIKRGQRGRNILLHGAVGSGKTTLARIYARALNCLSPAPDGSPCRDRCEPCRSGDGRAISGFDEYNVSRDGGDVVSVRAWVQRQHREEREFHYRILFFDEAQALTAGACDALLSAVEQPRDRVLFFFATTEVERIRPALRSRLVDLLIRPLPGAEAIAFLRKYAATEGVDYAPGALELLAGLRNGYPRDLLLGLDRVCEPGTRLTIERVRAAFDIDQTEVLLDYFAALADGDLARQTELVFAWRESEADKIRWIRTFLISLYHNDILYRRLVGNGIIAAIPWAACTSILDRFCRRLGLANHPALAPVWLRMMDFWSIPETATDATALRLRLTLFHHLVNSMPGENAEQAGIQSPLPAPSNPTAPLAAAASTAASPGFGPMPNSVRPARIEDPDFLTVADVRQIINAASFLVQEHGILLNATFEVRPALFGAEEPEACAALIAAFHNDLAACAAAWGGSFASITVVERDSLGIVGYLAAHLPVLAFHDPEDDKAAGPAEAWACDWRSGDGRVGGGGVRFAAAAVGEAATLAFHWDAALRLCAGLGKEADACDPETGRRQSLLRLLGIPVRSTRRILGTPLVIVSELLTDAAIAGACGSSLTPLSAFDDGAWAWVRQGWERDEVVERQATRAERVVERALVEKMHDGDALKARGALAKLEAAWSADPHRRRRRWRGWWA